MGKSKGQGTREDREQLLEHALECAWQLIDADSLGVEVSGATRAALHRAATRAYDRAKDAPTLVWTRVRCQNRLRAEDQTNG